MKLIWRIVLVLIVLGLLGGLSARPTLAAANLTACASTGVVGTLVTNDSACAYVVQPDTPTPIYFVVGSSWGDLNFAPVDLSFTLAADSVGTLNFTSEVTTNCGAGTVQIGIGVDTATSASIAQYVALSNVPTHVSLNVIVPLAAGSHTIHLIVRASDVSCLGASLVLSSGLNGYSFSASVLSNTASVTTVSAIRFTAHHTGPQFTFHWRVKNEPGIAGFNVYSGHTRLTKRPIAVHAAARYAFSKQWSGSGPYLLQVLRSDGAAVMVPATSGTQGG